MAEHQLWSIAERRLIVTSSNLRELDVEAMLLSDIGCLVVIVIDCSETPCERQTRLLIESWQAGGGEG